MAKASTRKAKAWTFEAKATILKHLARAEIKTRQHDRVDNELNLVSFIQGDHLSGKPGNVREFDRCQGNVTDFTRNQGNVREKSCQ